MAKRYTPEETDRAIRKAKEYRDRMLSNPSAKRQKLSDTERNYVVTGIKISKKSTSTPLQELKPSAKYGASSAKDLPTTSSSTPGFDLPEPSKQRRGIVWSDDDDELEQAALTHPPPSKFVNPLAKRNPNIEPESRVPEKRSREDLEEKDDETVAEQWKEHLKRTREKEERICDEIASSSRGKK